MQLNRPPLTPIPHAAPSLMLSLGVALADYCQGFCGLLGKVARFELDWKSTVGIEKGDYYLQRSQTDQRNGTRG
jgi:hypothetical protein